MPSRDDGWDLRDSEGWYRYRYCRPTTIRELKTPTRETDFVGWPGDLEEVRHTLAFTNDGRRFHTQENWQIHQGAMDTTRERAIGYSCLGAELLGADAEKRNWATTEFVGYSWFKDDQFAATKDLLVFNAMVARPPEVNFTGARPSMMPVADTLPTPPPPTSWLPFY